MKPSFEKQLNAWLAEIERQVKDPDFWKLTALFVVLLFFAIIFFILAIRYDFFIKFSGSFGVTCRQLGNLEAFLLFLSPFAVGLSFMAASGELINQLDIRRHSGKSLNWSPVFKAFFIAIFIFLLAGFLMVLWC